MGAMTVPPWLLGDPWAIWGIAAAAAAGVIFRPFAWPEFIWSVAGALLLLVLGLLSPADALAGVAKGTDVYLFLIGMMLLAELARQEGLFDWLAAQAATHAKGSATRLFSLVFAVGTIVTVFLSNDATAVVLTPAVAAVVRAAKVKQALPYLLICAFIANAASFVLPISNPANLVIYGRHMPPLLRWLPSYAVPSLLSIVATYLVLRWSQRTLLRDPVAVDIEVPALTICGKLAAFGIAATSVVLLASLGLRHPARHAHVPGRCATAILVLSRSESGPLAVMKSISWGVLPLVAGLFVLVEALENTGVTRDLAALLTDLARRSATRGGLDIRRGAGGGLQPGEQPARRAGRRPRGGDRQSPRTRARGGADRGGSGAEPVGDRIAGDHPVVDRVAARGAAGHRLGLPEAWRAGDAACVAAGDRRRLRVWLRIAIVPAPSAPGRAIVTDRYRSRPRNARSRRVASLPGS